MFKRSNFVKPEKNNFKIIRTIDNWHGEMPFSVLNKMKIKYNKNWPIYGDRFIPRRGSNKNKETNKKFYTEMEAVKDILFWDLPLKHCLQNSMMALLYDAFHISEKRILQFAEPTNNNNDDCDDGFYGYGRSYTTNTSINMNLKYKTTTEKNWLCKARRKPFAYAQSTHDSTGFSDCFERNMMDWSVNGQVVASFENEVVIWRTIKDASITFRVENTSCVAYCPNGKYLAIGCVVASHPTIEFWDVSIYGVRVKVIWRYFFKSQTLKINCFEWSKCGNFLVAGTNKGIIYVLYVTKLKIVCEVHQSYKYAVTILRFSPTMRYLASADTAGNVIIYNWTSNHKLITCLHVLWNNKTKIMLDWHPWKGVYDLAVAASKPATIAIINVPSKKTTAFYHRKDRRIQIDALVFNKITAELCVSISREDLLGYAESKIVVLESLNRIVDELTIEYGAKFLMWHPDGTRLVTAGNDDSLTIWKFYPDTMKKCSNSDRKNHPLNSKTEQQLFYGCDMSEKFQLWSYIR